MPAQVPTPRTTRNSCGLRQTPRLSPVAFSLGDSARVSRRRRQSSGTPTPANLQSRLAQLSSRLAQTPARPTAARPSIFPPPVVLHPITQSVSSPPPTRTARGISFPKTPVRYSRHRTRFIDVTPSNLPVPAPESPGGETRSFRLRRDKEGEERFARELWIAIRNDHYMRGCWCGPPNIYNSRAEAEVAAGHLRFYVVGAETKQLRVLQRKDDLRWHCICGNNDFHAVYKNLINTNGKRPAEDFEIDLITQNQGLKIGESIDRVVPALGDPIPEEEEQLRTPELDQDALPAPAQSMWTQACGILTRAVATMGSPFVTFYDKLREQLRGDAYETLDTRKKGSDNDAIVVKRLKRHLPAPTTGESSADNCDDGFDDLIWADDPTKRIGLKRIRHLLNAFVSQLESIKAGNVIGGASIAAIQSQIQDGQDLGASIAIHMYQEHIFGPMSPEEPEAERADKLLRTLKQYEDRLSFSIEFMQITYDRDWFKDIRKKYPMPPRRLQLGNHMFRQTIMWVGEFLCFLRSLDSVCEIDNATLETICQMIVDANATHKQLMLPSYVKSEENPTEDMPGFFPVDKVSAMEEVPADELVVQPLYDFKFPSSEPSDCDEQIKPGKYQLVPQPKGILKPSKVWDPPDSPKYVATPDKRRKLAFKNPVSKFIPPAHIPAKIMTAEEADRIVKAKLQAEVLRDVHSIRMFEASRVVSRQHDMSINVQDKGDLEALEAEDKEMGLTYHSLKYGSFLNGMHDDLAKQAVKDGENRLKPAAISGPRRHMVPIPLPPSVSTPERRPRTAHLLEDDTSSLGSSPGINPLMRPKAEQQPTRPANKKPVPRTLEQFFAEDEDDLAISTAKLEQLQLDRQIREEFEAGLRRDLVEKRKREEEEALREKQRQVEEERRRQEAERRRKAEERRREQEARRQKEADEFAALTGLRHPTRPLITTLSGDWDTKVTNAARANPSAELVKTLEGQPLTRRDFEEKLLPPTAWLNDNIIIGSILHVADYINRAKGATDQEPKCAAFTSYFWPRLLTNGPSGCGRLLRRAGVRKANLLNIDTILIPICAQSHWTLAVIRPGKRTVSHIDSMRGGGGDEKVKTKLLELVRFILEDQFVEAEWSGVDYEAPRQTNGWDCGVFTITNAMCMALGLNPKYAYTERELTLQRRRLAAMLLNEGFKGEFSLDGF